MDEIKELERRIESLSMEIELLKERVEDIKPFAMFAKEQDEIQEIDEQMQGDDDNDYPDIVSPH
jgi:hypothetical protein